MVVDLLFITPFRHADTFLYPVPSHPNSFSPGRRLRNITIMDRFPSGEDRFFSGRNRAVAGHILAATLVVVYANTFAVWAWIAALVGSDAARNLPYLALVLVLVFVIAGMARSRAFDWSFFILGATLAIGALFLTDPDFPAKRIHVPQYMVLSLILYRALSYNLPRGNDLCLAAATMATLYGVHDELLQGFHPDRTFGLRDLGIDAAGALSGALIARAFQPSGNDRARNPLAERDRPGTIAVMAVVAGTACLVLPLEGYRDQFIPAWSTLPLLAAGVITALLVSGDCARSLSFRVFAFAAFSLLLYPIASHVPTFHFH